MRIKSILVRLEEIERILHDFTENPISLPNYDKDGLRSVVKLRWFHIQCYLNCLTSIHCLMDNNHIGLKVRD